MCAYNLMQFHRSIDTSLQICCHVWKISKKSRVCILRENGSTLFSARTSNDAFTSFFFTHCMPMLRKLKKKIDWHHITVEITSSSSWKMSERFLPYIFKHPSSRLLTTIKDSGNTDVINTEVAMVFAQVEGKTCQL